MATFYDSEDISITTSPSGLDRTKIDNVSGARAERAYITANVPIFYSLIITDDLDTTNSFTLDAYELLEVIGYENLRQFRIQTQTGTGDAHVEYET